MADTLQRSDYLGLINQGRQSSSSFALSAAELEQRKLEQQKLEDYRKQQIRIQKEQIRVQDEDTAFKIDKLRLDDEDRDANRALTERTVEIGEAEEKRTASKQKTEDIQERWRKFTFDTASRINQLAINARTEGNLEKAQMYDKMGKNLSTRSTGGEDFDFISMIGAVYGQENIGQVLNEAGTGSSLLEDWKNPEKKGFANFAFNPETGMATTAVETERGIHPVTAGGINYSEGGEGIEGGEVRISDLNKLLNFHDAQFRSPEAALIAQTSGGKKKNLTLKDMFKDGQMDLLQLDRTEKEDLALSPNSTFERMSDIVAKDLYGELMVEPKIEPVDATFKITPSGIQATSGIDLSGENAADAIKDSFGGKFTRPGVFNRKYSRDAFSVVKNNPATYQNFTHDNQFPFGLTAEDQKELSQNDIKKFQEQSSFIANASARSTLNDLVYKNEWQGETHAGALGMSGRDKHLQAPRTDIGQMMHDLNTGNYKENTLINGERYSKAQAEEVKKFYEGEKNREALVEKLANETKYRQEFIDMGPMKFALSYADDPELFKRAGITTKEKTTAKRNIAQMKTYLKKNHDITIPTGANLTPESLEEFNKKVQALDISQEQKNKWDNTLAGILEQSIDRNTDTIDTTWLGSDNYNNYMAAMALSVTPDVDDSMRQHFYDLANFGKSSGLLNQDATDVDSFARFAAAQASLQVSGNAVKIQDAKTFNGYVGTVDAAIPIIFSYLDEEREWVGDKTFSRAVNADSTDYETAMMQAFQARKDVVEKFGPGSKEFNRINERLFPIAKKTAERYVEKNADDSWFSFMYGPDASKEASDLSGVTNFTTIKKEQDGTEREVNITKISDLINKKGEFDLRQIQNLRVVQGGRNIGRSGSFYGFVQEYGMEMGILILDSQGLKNDVRL